MARINLLPWRETLRKKRQRDFGTAALLAGLVTAGLCIGVYLYISDMIKYQEQRNSYLQREITLVNKKIKEIKELEKTKAQLIARMNVIQSLQSSRPQIVRLFDELVTTVPDGTNLTSMNQTGSAIKLVGVAQSNARVSAYMRNIEESSWLGDAVLQVISNEGSGGEAMSKFTLTAKQLAKLKGGE
jgi:type IV pilus assembly protein PilN